MVVTKIRTAAGMQDNIGWREHNNLANRKFRDMA